MSVVGRGRYDLSSQTYGSVPEWPKGADCKSAGIAYVGSNPARPTMKRPIALAIGRLCFFNDVAVKGANPVPPPKGGRLGSLSMVLPTDSKSLPPGSGNGKRVY